MRLALSSRSSCGNIWLPFQQSFARFVPAVGVGLGCFVGYVRAALDGGGGVGGGGGGDASSLGGGTLQRPSFPPPSSRDDANEIERVGSRHATDFDERASECAARHDATRRDAPGLSSKPAWTIPELPLVAPCVTSSSRSTRQTESA